MTIDGKRHTLPGLSPALAASEAVARVAALYPAFSGAVVALDVDGNHGAACHGFPTFPYTVGSHATGDEVRVFKVPCMGQVMNGDVGEDKREAKEFSYHGNEETNEV